MFYIPIIESCFSLQREDRILSGAVYIGAHRSAILERQKKEFLARKEEQDYCAKSSQNKDNYLLSRYCGKKALMLYAPQIKAQQWQIRNGVFGQPVLHSPCSVDPRLSISLAHTSSYGAALVFPEIHPMGIDIESCDRAANVDSIFSVSTKEEIALLRSSLSDDDLVALYLWTSKEALSKVLRVGLMIEFKYLSLASFIYCGSNYLATFTHFPQYKALIYLKDKLVISIVLPQRTTLNYIL